MEELMTTLRNMVKPLKQSENNDSLLNRNLKDVGYILRWRKIMQRVLFLWHSLIQVNYFMIKTKTHVGEWLGLHPWVKCEGRRWLILLWPLK
jgi:hypothetical protein